MPRLADQELADIAQALRAFAAQERGRARVIDNPDLHRGFVERADRHALLAERIEKARKTAPPR